MVDRGIARLSPLVKSFFKILAIKPNNSLSDKLCCNSELLNKLLCPVFLFFSRKAEDPRESFGRESVAKVGKVNSAVVSVERLYPLLATARERGVFSFDILKRRALV